MSFVVRSVAFLFLALLISLLVLSPSFRESVFTLSKNQRLVLAALPIHLDNADFKIVKIRQGPHILIEIYLQKKESSELHSRFEFENKKDVYYDFKSSVTNMFIANIDQNASEEILIPLLDQNLESQIKVIRYSSEQKKFFID